MYYGYKVIDADGDEYTGVTYSDNFVEAMDNIDDYYDDVPAVKVSIVCLTESECMDMSDIDDDEDEDEDEKEDDYDETHGDCCDGNFSFKLVDSHVDTDELEKLGLLFKLFKEEE